jgi:hypothetical protein
MANPSVTYTFTNGNVADASQVNQNFSDLISSLTDGSKSINIDAITAAGTATFNGNTVIGNASGDTSTVNATTTFVTAPKVDTISENTSGAGVTIDGLKLKDGGIFGKTDSYAVGAGYVGEVLSAQNSAVCTSGGGTPVLLTLTAGEWLVTTVLQLNATVSCIGMDATLYSKGASMGTTLGRYRMLTSVASGTYGTLTFGPQRVNIVTGDADKTVSVDCIAVGASATVFGYIIALRIA